MSTASSRTEGALQKARVNSEKGTIKYSVIGILLVLIYLFPVYWMINVSVQNSSAAIATPFFPTDFSLDGYAKAISEQMHPLLVSLVVALGSVIVSLSIAAPGAYALSRFRIPGSQFFLLCLLLSQMIPGIVVANALYGVYADIGLINSIGGLILADASLGIPFAMLILQPFMRSIPDAIVEASWMDGAGPLRTFFTIIIPMSRNALVTAGLFSFLFAWGDFLFALTLTTSPSVRPVTLAIYTYLGAYISDWSPLMATAVLASLPAIILLVVAQRFVAAGVSAGAVK